jgi:AraC-like DNA-binding protein
MEHDVGPLIPIGYTEHVPPPDVADHVACFWTRVATPSAAGEPGPAHRVLPDGSVDIVVGFETGSDPEAVAVGTMTQPLIVPPGSPTVYVGVRFRPAHAFAALGLPAIELTDRRVALDLVATDARRMIDDVMTRTTNGERLDSLVRLVRHRLAGAPEIPVAVRRAVQLIASDYGNLRVAALAADIGITRQHLARQFATHVGVSPKTFARVMRARAAVARADAARAAYPRDIDWSAIAYELGYYDQPHFIDDFKAITGKTPSQWLAGKDGAGELGGQSQLGSEST